MNFYLSQIPERNLKPRTHGITMVMDKGLSVEEARMKDAEVIKEVGISFAQWGAKTAEGNIVLGEFRPTTVAGRVRRPKSRRVTGS